MPNNRNHSDAELAALLKRAEPPKSPDHLDDLIIGYAREKAAKSDKNSVFQIFTVGSRWLNRNWISAAATFSVAVVAVSISLQIFEPAEVTFNASNKIADSVNVALEANEVASPVPAEPISQQPALAEVAVVSNQNIALAVAPSIEPEPQVREREEQRQIELVLAQTVETTAITTIEPPQPLNRIETDTNAIAQSDTTQNIQPANPAQSTALNQQAVPERQQRTVAIASTNDQLAVRTGAVSAGGTSVFNSVDSIPVDDDNPTTDVQVEEIIVTGSFIRRDNFNQASPLTQTPAQTPTQTSFEDLLVNDEIIRSSFIELMYRVLISFNQNESVDSLETDNDATNTQSILDAFSEITDLSELLVAGDRYSQARQNFTPRVLPETLGTAIEILRAIEF